MKQMTDDIDVQRVKFEKAKDVNGNLLIIIYKLTKRERGREVNML